MFQHEMKNAYIGEVWTPWSNTLLYMPLDNDTADHSGNNIWTTNTGVSIQTYQWVKCWYFNNAHIQVNDNLTIPSKKTFLCWVYCTWTYPSQYDGKIIDIRNSSAIRLLTAWYKNNTQCYYFNINETYYNFQTWLKNQWVLISTVDSWSNNTCRIMWENLNLSWTLSKTTSWTSAYINIWNDYNNWVDRYFLWWMSELILEAKEWTWTEISHYYDITKWNYWIS